MPRILSIRNIDLNLLPILMALLEEESVTGASKRVHLSQSATSSALRRIRDTFKDPILIADGKQMRLSPKARLIREELRLNLDNIANLMSKFVPINIKDEKARVAISAPEHVFVAMPSLLCNVFNNDDDKAHVLLTEFCQSGVFDELRSDETDLSIASFGVMDESFERHKLYTEGLIVVMRQDHPALAMVQDGRISLSATETYRHVVVSHDEMSPDSMLSRLFNKRGISRKVEAMLPSVFSLPMMLRNSDFICVGTARGLEQHKALHDLVCVLPPLELKLDYFDIEMVWRKDKNDDPILTQIRQQIIDLAAQMPPLNE